MKVSKNLKWFAFLLILLSSVTLLSQEGNAEKAPLRFGSNTLDWPLNKISVGIANSSVSTSEIDGTAFRPSNGLRIGLSYVYPLIYRGDKVGLSCDDSNFDKNEKKDKDIFVYIMGENEFAYVQKDFKVSYDNGDSKIISRDYLEYSQKYKYDFLGKKVLYPFFGASVSWLLSTDGYTPNKTWINDVSLLFGVDFFGFTYEYSHGTFTSVIEQGHKAKTETHSFSFSLSF